ncbi:hypothetical protein KJ865_10465, partial [Myxococcota bacterium]|nr:hypothetical protein [Myxococcota bacterium]
MRFILCATLILSVFSCTAKKKQTRPVKKIIPLTVANMRGHKMLYKEGWYVVTSTERALNFAYRHSVISSREAIIRAARDVVAQGDAYGKELTGDLKSSYEQAKAILRVTSQNTKSILTGTHDAGKTMARWTKEGFKLAWSRFIYGNMALVDRT